MTKRENEMNENRSYKNTQKTPNKEKNKNNGVSHVIHFRDPLPSGTNTNLIEIIYFKTRQ